MHNQTNNPPGYVGTNEAAKLTGKNKTVIKEDAESGKLPSTKNDKGYRIFQIADLLNIYGPFKKQVTGDASSSDNQFSPPEKTSVSSDITGILEAKEQVIKMLQDQIEDVKRERDRWHNAYEMKLLPAPTPVVQAPANDLPAMIVQPTPPPEIKLNRLQAFAAVFTGKVKIGANG